MNQLYIFFYLLLGHLVGDYVLQTNFIARYKNQKFWVLSFHVFIVTLATYLIVMPDNLINGLLIILLGVIHFFIDLSKLKFNRKKFFNGPHYYLYDQLLHFSSMLLISYFYIPKENIIPFNLSVILCLGFFNAYFIGILSSFIFGDITKYRRDHLGYILRFSIPLLYYPWLIILSIPLYTFLTMKFKIFDETKSNNEKLFSLSLSYLISILIIIVLEVMA